MPALCRPVCAHLREPSTTAEFIRHQHYHAAELGLQHARSTVEKSSLKPLRALSIRKFYEPLTDVEWTMLDRLLSSSRAWGDASLANPQTRYRFQHSLIHALLNHYEQIFDQSDCRTFLATFAWDSGMTSCDTPIIPISSMQRTVQRTLRGLGLSGVGNFEFDVLRRRLRGENFRRLSAQAHVICWTTDRDFRPEATANNLSSSGRFPNILGIPPVDIVSRARSDARRGINFRESPEKDQTPRSIAHLGYYITKAKFCSLNRKPTGPNGERAKLLPDQDHFTLSDAMRLADINSHFCAGSSLFAFGQGNEIALDQKRIFQSTANTSTPGHARLKADVIERAFSKIWGAQNISQTIVF